MVDFAKALRETRAKKATAVAAAGPVLLVDGLNCAIRSHFAAPELTAPNGDPTGAVYGVANRVREAVEKFQPSRVVVCWDGGRSAWRRGVFAGYKDRPPSSESTDLRPCFAQKPTLRALLGAMGCDQVEVEGVEADDLVAWFSMLPSARRAGSVVVLSSDRDFYQLIDDRVSVYLGVSAGKGRAVEHVTPETFRDATRSSTLPSGVEDPGEWAAYRVVNGDSSDRIPGVRGLSGEKRWPMVRETLRDLGYAGDVQDFFVGQDVTELAHGAGMEVGRYRFGVDVSENWQLLERNAVLMSLPFAVGMLGRQGVDPAGATVAGAWDERAVERTCARLNMQQALRNWGQWRDPLRGLAERRGSS